MYDIFLLYLDDWLHRMSVRLGLYLRRKDTKRRKP